MNFNEKLRAIIHDFINNITSIQQFCDLFADTYNLEYNTETLSEEEISLFNELLQVTYGYTTNDDLLRQMPQYHFNDLYVRNTVDMICDKLGIK